MLDEVTKRKCIIDYLIEHLRQGNYVRYTNKYTGSYWQGQISEDRLKINKDNIYFVNGDTVITKYNERIELRKCIFIIEFEGIKEMHTLYLAIDVTDWKLYLYIKV